MSIIPIFDGPNELGTFDQEKMINQHDHEWAKEHKQKRTWDLQRNPSICWSHFKSWE